MLLITIFVELRVVSGRSRTRTGRLSTAVLCRGLEKNGMVRAWHGRGMASVNQTQPHCVDQMGKTHSKPLPTRLGRGTAWVLHAMCESALRSTRLVSDLQDAHVKLDFTSWLHKLDTFSTLKYKPCCHGGANS